MITKPREGIKVLSNIQKDTGKKNDQSTARNDDGIEADSELSDDPPEGPFASTKSHAREKSKKFKNNDSEIQNHPTKLSVSTVSESLSMSTKCHPLESPKKLENFDPKIQNYPIETSVSTPEPILEWTCNADEAQHQPIFTPNKDFEIAVLKCLTELKDQITVVEKKVDQLATRQNAVLRLSASDLSAIKNCPNKERMEELFNVSLPLRTSESLLSFCTKLRSDLSLRKETVSNK